MEMKSLHRMKKQVKMKRKALYSIKTHVFHS